MNRINQMIDNLATIASMCFYQAKFLGEDGLFEESADMTHRMREAHREMKTWLKISQAIRGWKL